MKPEQFIRDFGVEKAREVVEGAPKYAQRYRAGMYLKQGEWTWFWSEISGKWLQYEKHIYSTSHFDFAVDLSDLKRLVESLDIIWKFGSDIEGAKQLLEFVKDCESVSIGQRTIQVERLAQAIRDHESIYGGGDEI
ncbi:hypothetical protein [Acinetobacter nosocomialis]